jgi:hypothetical protein
MPWDRSQPTAAKYRTAEHRHTRQALMAQLKRDGYGTCAEVVCVMTSRTITADMKLALCHLPDGVTYAGLGHSRCNQMEAVRRGHQTRRRRRQSIHSREWFA